MSSLQLAAIAFPLGIFATVFVASFALSKTRRIENIPNKTTEAPSDREMKWHLVHIRDDMSSTFGALCITNGLLAVIAALLLLRAF